MVETEEVKVLYYTPLQAQIIHLLNKNVVMSRDDLCRELGYGTHTVEFVQAYPDKKQYKTRHHRKLEQYDGRTTVYDNLVKLQKRKVVEKFSYNAGERGRPLVFWQLRDEVVP